MERGAHVEGVDYGNVTVENMIRLPLPNTASLPSSSVGHSHYVTSLDFVDSNLQPNSYRWAAQKKMAQTRTELRS